jgi:capsular polysaccharide transport system permease protein
MVIVLILAGNTGAIPRNPIALAEAILLVVFFGMGLGMVNAVMQTFIPTWTAMFTLVMGPLYLLSGVWFLPQEIPPPFRGYLLLNPVMHLIMWFRSGFYPASSVATYLDRGYAVSASVGIFVLGLALQRVMRRKLLEPV